MLQTLKFAWIQYLSLALVSFWIFYGIVGFIFRHKIVDTAVSSDLVSKKRFGGEKSEVRKHLPV